MSDFKRRAMPSTRVNLSFPDPLLAVIDRWCWWYGDRHTLVMSALVEFLLTRGLIDAADVLSIMQPKEGEDVEEPTYPAKDSPFVGHPVSMAARADNVRLVDTGSNYSASDVGDASATRALPRTRRYSTGTAGGSDAAGADQSVEVTEIP